MNAAALGASLRAQRARLRPGDVGLPDSPGRRVPGLRRGEVAQLAGVSADYYARIEQGRCTGLSENVIESVCLALRIDGERRAELLRLAGEQPQRAGSRPGTLQPALADACCGPALVVDARCAVTAWNPLAAILIADFASIPPADRNLARLAFGVSGAGAVTNAHALAPDTVTILRLAVAGGRSPRALACLIGELTIASDDFAICWLEARRRPATDAPRMFWHPEIGELPLTPSITATADRPHRLVVSYTAPVESPPATSLRLLETWLATTVRAPT